MYFTVYGLLNIFILNFGLEQVKDLFAQFRWHLVILVAELGKFA